MIAEPVNRMMHLPDGEYLLRSLQPGDLHHLQEFFYSHSQDTIYQRYGHPVRVMSEADAEKLVAVNQTQDCALALLEVREKQTVIHAVGRYCLDPDNHHAELAFVVRESKRQLGCTTCLMQELIRTARERKLKALWAEALASNLPMRKVLDKFGFQLISRDHGRVKFELPLE
ncbi:MAG: GNAT family N-acetyltransferase [Verrucomicrobiota bacterium]